MFLRNVGTGVPTYSYTASRSTSSIQSALESLCSCYPNQVKVKCTLVQALRLCTGRTAHRGE